MIQIRKNINFRNAINVLEDGIRNMPDAQNDDQDDCPLTHKFAEGIYVREIFIPKGKVLVGKIHKHAHPNFLMRGEVIVVTEEGRERLKAPLSMISAAGTKRAVYALEDTVWVTVHATNEMELDKIEDDLIAKSYDEFDKLQAIKMEEISKVLSEGE